MTKIKNRKVDPAYEVHLGLYQAIPDPWESIQNLNPIDSTDGKRIVPNGKSPKDRHPGYTYLK